MIDYHNNYKHDQKVNEVKLCIGLAEAKGEGMKVIAAMHRMMAEMEMVLKKCCQLLII